MADGITPDGGAIHNRVETKGNRKLHASVVDNVLNSTTLFSRLQGRAKPFGGGDRRDFTVKITDSAQGQAYSGLETLNSAASDTTITLSYSHTAVAQPVVNILFEAMANAGSEAVINLQAFKMDEAVMEIVSKMGGLVYGTGSGKNPLGLGAIVDDGTDVGTIGGQSRTTYTGLKATRTASGGTLSLSKLATLFDNVSAAGIMSEEPTLIVTTKAIWSNYEELLQPSVRASYASVGYDRLPIRGTGLVRPAELKGGAGFTALTYRGVPLIKDDAAPAEKLWMINENYLAWYGRTRVPAEYNGSLSKVSLGRRGTMEGNNFLPSKAHGVFFQEMQMMPNAAGMIGRYHIYGQLMSGQLRRHGVSTGILGI